MAEIWTRNGVSCQVFQTTAQSIATATVNTQDITLDRAGVFLGASISPFVNAASIGAACTMAFALTKTDDTQIAYGDAISTVRVKYRNDSGGNRTAAVYVMVLIGYGI